MEGDDKKSPAQEQLTAEELLRAARGVRKPASELVAKGRSLVESGQKAIETANAVEELVKNAPDGSFTNPVFGHLARGLNEFARVAAVQAKR